MGKLCRGYPGLTGISERSVIHASINAKSRKLLMYIPSRTSIIPPGQKLQRSRILATSCVYQGKIEDVDAL